MAEKKGDLAGPGWFTHAHIGEVSTTVWPDVLKAICKRKNINVLE